MVFGLSNGVVPAISSANQKHTAIALDNYGVGLDLGPWPNPGCQGVRVWVYVDNVTTGYEAEATAVLSFGVASVTVTDGGTGYTAPPTVGFTGGGGTGAAGTAVLTDDVVTSVTMTDAGTGYTSAPTVEFTGGDGTGAAGTAVLETSGVVDSITVDEGGQGYASAPTVVFTGGGGTGAAATATLTDDAVTSIAVDTAGSSYETPPAITFTGGGTEGSIKVSIEQENLSPNTRYVMLESAALTTTGLKGPYTVDPRIATVANVSKQMHPGTGFYVHMVHSAAGNWQYSVMVELLN